MIRPCTKVSLSIVTVRTQVPKHPRESTGEITSDYAPPQCSTVHKHVGRPGSEGGVSEERSERGKVRRRGGSKEGRSKLGEGASVCTIHPSSFERVACESAFVAELVMTAGEKRLRDLKRWWM